jgi:hypothetical protein
MVKWRIIVGFFAAVLILANFNVFGFHEPSQTYEAITIVGLAIITCICDAVKVLRANHGS